MTAAVFRARDARQRRHLLRAIGTALDYEDLTALVAKDAYEGPDTSAYVLTFFDVGFRSGWRMGYNRGRDRGIEVGMFGTSAQAVADQAKARQRRRRGKAKR